eukprot:jgi/Phyca11/531572/estExt2_fgenesh1_pg.C_PHYCAscaffold_10197
MAKKFKNWYIKPLAMYHTDVRHAMLMDVDDIMMKDPSVLREADGYKQTGTLFFYDRLFRNFNYEKFNISGGEDPSEQVFESFAYNGKTCHEMDSSLVLIDKKRVGQTVFDVMLWFVTQERFRFIYSHGDKETFWLAFELAHYMPVTSGDAEMLYVNGKALLDPYPQGIDYVPKAQWNNMFNTFPTHMTPRLPRTELNKTGHGKMYAECLIALGATPLPDSFADFKDPATLRNLEGYNQTGTTFFYDRYLPDNSPDAQMLYVNGKALLEPYPEGIDMAQKMRTNNMFNTFPTLMTPRQERQVLNKTAQEKGKLYSECLVELGGIPLPKEFAGHLLRRRLFYLGATTAVFGALQHCETYELRRLLQA